MKSKLQILMMFIMVGLGVSVEQSIFAKSAAVLKLAPAPSQPPVHYVSDQLSCNYLVNQNDIHENVSPVTSCSFTGCYDSPPLCLCGQKCNGRIPPQQCVTAGTVDY